MIMKDREHFVEGDIWLLEADEDIELLFDPRKGFTMSDPSISGHEVSEVREAGELIILAAILVLGTAVISALVLCRFL